MTGHDSESQLRSGAQAGTAGRRLSPDPNVAVHVDDVAAALNLVDEMTALVAADINQGLREATDTSDFARAHQLLELAERLSVFRSVAEDAAKEWARIAGLLAKRTRNRARRSATVSRLQSTASHKKEEPKRANYGKVSPDEKTSQRQFRIPILEALVDMGGSGSVSDVLGVLEKEMGPVFKQADVAPLPSNPRELRWRNTAQWTRQELVNDGLIGPPRRRGIWEITDSGREYLRTYRSSNR